MCNFPTLTVHMSSKDSSRKRKAHRKRVLHNTMSTSIWSRLLWLNKSWAEYKSITWHQKSINFCHNSSAQRSSLAVYFCYEMQVKTTPRERNTVGNGENSISSVWKWRFWTRCLRPSYLLCLHTDSQTSFITLLTRRLDVLSRHRAHLSMLAEKLFSQF